MTERLQTPPRPRRRAFTLAEAMLASAILLTAILAITLPFASAARNQFTDSRQTLAAGLAQEMMDEILSRKFYSSEPNAGWGPSQGQTRAQFDSYSDYNGYGEGEGNVRNFRGYVCTDPLAANLSRSVSVTQAYVSGQSVTGPCTFALIKVMVWDGNMQVVELSRLAYAYP